VRALPQLRSLHLGRPIEAPLSLMLSASSLDLPHLTSLVLGPRVGISTFASLTHLASLAVLKVTLSAYVEERATHPQDLAALRALPHLSHLTVCNWWVGERQEVAALQGLSELHLERFTGPLTHLKPAAAMPKVIGATFTRATETQDMRYREDSVFARWALRKIHKKLPNVQVGCSALSPCATAVLWGN
jgi:hypothetical protein